MDYGQLKNYLAEKAEIDNLARRIENPDAWKDYYGHSTILDYRKGTPRPQMVQGYDLAALEKARQQWAKRKDLLEQRAKETEEYIESHHKKGRLLWCNAIVYNYKTVLSAGHTDDVAVLGDPDKGWGWIVDRGFDMIQTDWTLLLRNYLDQE